jgi:hypothetical protein
MASRFPFSWFDQMVKTTLTEVGNQSSFPRDVLVFVGCAREADSRQAVQPVN